MDADGSNARNLTQNPGQDGRDGGVLWSPDGRKIAFCDRTATRTASSTS